MSTSVKPQVIGIDISDGFACFALSTDGQSLKLGLDAPLWVNGEQLEALLQAKNQVAQELMNGHDSTNILVEFSIELGRSTFLVAAARHMDRSRARHHVLRHQFETLQPPCASEHPHIPQPYLGDEEDRADQARALLQVRHAVGKINASLPSSPAETVAKAGATLLNIQRCYPEAADIKKIGLSLTDDLPDLFFIPSDREALNMPVLEDALHFAYRSSLSLVQLHLRQHSPKGGTLTTIQTPPSHLIRRSESFCAYLKTLTTIEPDALYLSVNVTPSKTGIEAFSVNAQRELVLFPQTWANSAHNLTGVFQVLSNIFQSRNRQAAPATQVLHDAVAHEFSSGIDDGSAWCELLSSMQDQTTPQAMLQAFVGGLRTSMEVSIQAWADYIDTPDSKGHVLPTRTPVVEGSHRKIYIVMLGYVGHCAFTGMHLKHESGSLARLHEQAASAMTHWISQATNLPCEVLDPKKSNISPLFAHAFGALHQAMNKEVPKLQTPDEFQFTKLKQFERIRQERAEMILEMEIEMEGEEEMEDDELVAEVTEADWHYAQQKGIDVSF